MDHIKIIADPPPPSSIVGEWSAKRVTKLNNNLYELEDLYLENVPGAPVIELSGNHMLSAYNNYYWHFIHEDLAYYEGLKIFVPDLKLTLIDVAFLMDNQKEIKSELKGTYPYIPYFLDIYPQDVYLSKEKNMRFEKVYYVPTSGDIFRSNLVFKNHGVTPVSLSDKNDYIEWSNSPWDLRAPYGPIGLYRLTSKLKQRIKIDLDSPKKIFISRRDVNERLKKLINKPGYEHLVEERLFEDGSLEDYFESRGYAVVALEEFEYEKQMQLFMGATHVAGTVGAGFANLHMCNPGTKLFELHVIPIYGFDYGYYSRQSKINYNPIELRNLEDKRPLSHLDMKKVLDTIDL
jgi:hypothetical protein